MRKLRWTIAIVTIAFVIVAMIAVLRKPSDDLAGLRPFVVDDHTDYIREDNFTIVPPPPTPPSSISRRVIRLRGITQDQLLAYLHQRVARMPGWTVTIHRGEKLSFKADPSGNSENEIRASGPTKLANGTMQFSVEEVHELSSWDVFTWRVRHLGKDPFVWPPTP